MIPLKCESHPSRFFFATVLIIVLCGAVFWLEPSLMRITSGFVPLDFTYALFHPGKRTLDVAVSCAAAFFMHANLFHLLSNMWYLWIFGCAVEYQAGFVRFGALYLICGAVSMIVQAGCAPLSSVPIVGASGAIAGIMGAFLVILPFSRIVMWFPPIFLLRTPAFAFLLLWIALQYVNARSTGVTHVAWWAHIGGFAAGLILGLGLRGRGVRDAAAGGGKRRAGNV